MMAAFSLRQNMTSRRRLEREQSLWSLLASLLSPSRRRIELGLKKDATLLLVGRKKTVFSFAPSSRLVLGVVLDQEVVIVCPIKVRHSLGHRG